MSERLITGLTFEFTEKTFAAIHTAAFNALPSGKLEADLMRLP